MNDPLILEIRGNSLDDGPGIRTVVFFKGCPLSCAWCHNPESKRVQPEISYDAAECVGCDACMRACPENALSRRDKGFVDREKCTLCFTCAESCPSGALARVGRNLSVTEIVDEVSKDRPFFENSGGGVTLSGGEPTFFMDFASGILSELKKKKIRTLVETCGFFRWEEFAKNMIPYLDAVYFDIKLIDDRDHRRYCGVPNGGILSNFEKLSALAAGGKTTLLPRTPLVPGITDTDLNLAGIADFLKKLGIEKAVLLPYNPMWLQKSGKIGALNPLAGRTETGTWMDSEKIAHCRAIFSEHGIDAGPVRQDHCAGNR